MPTRSSKRGVANGNAVDDEDGETIQVKPRVKEEKVKVKEEKSKGKRKARVVVEDEESEQEQEQAEPSRAQGPSSRRNGDADMEAEEPEASASPRGQKRLRVNRGGDSVTSPAAANGDGEDDDDEQGANEQNEPNLPRPKTLPRDVDGYIPGSIVRIQLSNFVTYDYVQFRPGPYLNMILGPNGTGKSSIACAIALGLNFPPSVLGRALELSAFVKNGTQTGYIEIELKGPAGQGNLTIRRNLSASSRSSTFTLNGTQCTATEIKKRVAELNVQVANLCSFLPQDKVSEFAAMTPQQLLRETQRAAGDEQLTEWHDTLIHEGKVLRDLEHSIKEDEDQLNQLSTRNKAIEQEVERFKERKQLEHNIDLLNVLLPVAEYRDIRLHYIEVKEHQRKLHAKVQECRARNAPAHALLEKMKVDLKNKEQERDTMKKAFVQKMQKLSDKKTTANKLEAETEKINSTLSEIKNEERNRVSQIKTTEREIEKLDVEINKPPPDDLPDLEMLSDEMKGIQLEKAHLAGRRNELNDQVRELSDRQGRASAEFQRAQSELKRQDDADLQKLSMMQRWDRDTHDAIIWLRHHTHLFRMEVFEPPFMSLSVKDRRFTDAVEACINANQMRTFVAQCQEDIDTLNKHINDDNALQRQPQEKKARINTWYRIRDEGLLVPPPMSPQELAELGFNGYALDYVDCPDGLAWFLKRDANLHRTAIALNGANVDVNRAMEYVARPIPPVYDNDSHRPISQGSGGGANFINGLTLNNVSRSRYGKKAVNNMTREIGKAKSLVVPTIDPELKRSIEEAIMRAREQLAACEEELKELEEIQAAVSEEDKSLSQRLEFVNRQRERIKKEKARVVSAQQRLDRAKDKLRDLKDRPPVEERTAKLRKQLLDLSKKRFKIAQDANVIIHTIVAEHAACTTAVLQSLQIQANYRALQALCQRKDAKYNQALEQFNEVNEEYGRVKAQCKNILDQSREIVSQASPDIEEAYRAIEDKRTEYEAQLKLATANGTEPPDPTGVELRSANEVREELETMQAKLDLNLMANPGILEQYERRQGEIEVLERMITEKKKGATKTEKKIKTARDNWQPTLEKLVASIGAKFSAAFDGIGCAGEIRISQHEDYEKWAIDILVKFREGEKLQLLTAHRQSGGERSLTTIMYLMSLTEEARAPFSLVDEINQGMDQRAERAVHDSMVEVTCKEDSAQYFLITPKLLTDLKYHERMKILCVNNGEWLPEEKNLGNMMQMINGYVEAMRSRGSNSA